MWISILSARRPGPAHNEEIIAAIAGGNEPLAAMLRDHLGSDEEFAPLDPAEPEP